METNQHPTAKDLEPELVEKLMRAGFSAKDANAAVMDYSVGALDENRPDDARIIAIIQATDPTAASGLSEQQAAEIGLAVAKAAVLDLQEAREGVADYTPEPEPVDPMSPAGLRDDIDHLFGAICAVEDVLKQRGPMMVDGFGDLKAEVCQEADTRRKAQEGLFVMIQNLSLQVELLYKRCDKIQTHYDKALSFAAQERERQQEQLNQMAELTQLLVTHVTGK